MKKRISAVLLVLVLLVPSLLSGCHGSMGMSAFSVPDDLDTDRSYTITFWAKNDTNKTQVAVYQKAIDEFQAIYPNVKVNLRLYTDYGRIYNDVITNISTQTTPNICITYPDHIATYMTGTNTVVPLDDLMNDPEYGLGGSKVPFDAPTISEIVPEFLQECVLEDRHYALPFMRSTEACYINQDFVEALGYQVPDILTWDFIWEVSEKAARKDADGTYLLNGQKVMIPFIYKSTDNMMIQMLKQKGAPYSAEDGQIGLFSDSTKEILEDVARAAAAESFSTFKISSYPGNFLNAGQCVFAIDSTAGATWMGANAPLSDIHTDKKVDFTTAVRIIPQYDPDHPQMISQGPSVCIFNKSDAQEVLYSWLFVQYLLTNEIQIGYSQTEGYVPVTTKAQQADAYQEYLSRAGEDNDLHYRVKMEASVLLMNNTGNTFITPVYNGSASLRDASGQLIENTVKSVRRHETIDDAYFERMFKEVSSLYRLDSHSRATFQAEGTSQDSLGPLPRTSVALLCTIAGIWILLLLYTVSRALKRRHNTKSTD